MAQETSKCSERTLLFGLHPFLMIKTGFASSAGPFKARKAAKEAQWQEEMSTQRGFNFQGMSVNSEATSLFGIFM